MKKRLYLIYFLPLGLIAQLNESNTQQLDASLSITGFYQSGNVETFIFRAKTDLSFKTWKNGVFKNQKREDRFLTLGFTLKSN